MKCFFFFENIIVRSIWGGRWVKYEFVPARGNSLIMG